MDSSASYKVIKKNGMAKRAHFATAHGTVETPLFMNVATAGAIKGGISSADLEEIGTQVALCNTYHMHVRTGDETVRELGGIRRLMDWKGPVLTDSGGFQVFSLSKLRNIKEEGVTFRSHVDGALIFMGPEESMRIQSNLGSTIAMAFDECPNSMSEYGYVKESVARTERWLIRCRDEMKRLKEMPDTVNRDQLLFGINQGAVFNDIRMDNADRISELDLDGYAVGGLAVGETAEQMYDVLDHVVPHLPENKPVYLMGVGTPENILEAVYRGVDFFDCVYPCRNGRHGHVYTFKGKINIHNARFTKDMSPLEEGCDCPVCRRYSRAYIRHLFVAREMLGMRLCALHNLYFYNRLMSEIRKAIEEDRYESFMKETLEGLKGPA
ncbi:MAG: tRNA guanosine(34) transglycosylase Tgt [Lachnospiraceae bacterium]|nr:tRNA guanosine(34) transglycosylase Tgt [Lachnospiraceae bacterium]